MQRGFSGWMLKNVYLDNVIQDECKNWSFFVCHWCLPNSVGQNDMLVTVCMQMQAFCLLFHPLPSQPPGPAD